MIFESRYQSVGMEDMDESWLYESPLFKTVGDSTAYVKISLNFEKSF